MGAGVRLQDARVVYTSYVDVGSWLEGLPLKESW